MIVTPPKSVPEGKSTGGLPAKPNGSETPLRIDASVEDTSTEGG